MAILTNTITEYTADSGVTIEGVPVKDGLVDGIDVSTIGAASHAQNTDTGTTGNTFTIDSDSATGKMVLDVALNAGEDHTMTITNAAMTADVTITLPATTGTVALSGAAPTAHAASHVNGTDDIQTATAAQKGVMSAAAMAKLDGIESGADVTDATNVLAALAEPAADVVFNEAGHDHDFRVEGVGVTHALFVQGSDGNVGIGMVPGARCTVSNLSGSADETLLQLINNRNTADDVWGIGFYNPTWGYEARITCKNRNSSGCYGELHLQSSGGAGGLTAGIYLDYLNNVGINETSPGTLLDMAGTAPYLTIHNTTHEDGDGGREGKLIFEGEQSGGELTTLGEIEISHDGANDDEKGKFVLRLNDGSDGTSPTTVMTALSSGYVGIGCTPGANLQVGTVTGSGGTGFIRTATTNGAGGYRTWEFGTDYNTPAYSWTLKDIEGGITAIAVLYGSGNVGIGCTPRYKLELSTGSGSVFNVASSSSVAHGMTDVLPTDAFYGHALHSSLGNQLYYFSGGDFCPFLGYAIFGTNNPTASTSAWAFIAGKKSGTGLQALAAAETCFQIQNYGTNLVTVLGSGNVGLGESSPGTLFDMAGASPYLTTHCTTHTDSDGARISKWIAEGEQSGGELTTLGEIEFSHDGANDDEKGKFILRLNDGNDGASPTNVIIASTDAVALGSELRFLEPPASGTNYTAFKAQAQSGNVTYTLPAADAAASGYVLSSNGSGTLSWVVNSVVDSQLSLSEPSANNTATGIVEYVNVAVSVVFGDLLYLKSDGNWGFADADQASTMPGIRMALETVDGSGTPASCKVLVSGRARKDTWSWTVPNLLYASTTGTSTNTLTATAPSGTGDQVQVVGQAYAATKIIFNPSPVLVEIL